jgi:WD40 repeat protein
MQNKGGNDMRKNMIMIGAGMMLALASCDKTEIREITEDRVVPQPVDTIKVADHFYLDGHLSRTAEDLGGRPLDAANLFNDGEELYVANFAGKCVDVFDAETLEFKRSMSNGDRTLARDVYAEGDHLFVAAGENQEVQIFDRKTGKYLSRLGTGSWPASMISKVGCVCATPRLVFVRDSDRIIGMLDSKTKKVEQNEGRIRKHLCITRATPSSLRASLSRVCEAGKIYRFSMSLSRISACCSRASLFSTFTKS